MNSFRPFILSMTLCVSQSIHSQTTADTSSATIPGQQESVEQLLDQVETESERSEIIDRLNWLQEHPFNLNTVSKEELTTLPGMTPFDAEAVINLRTSLRVFRSPGQIGLLDGGNEILARIRPYVIVEDETYSRSSINLISRTSRDLQPRKGFENNSFTGSAFKNYDRITFSDGNNIQSGVLFEKDAG
ncbi:MAG: helix-hairpin-helix domain-containing protein, partial [bacterium]